MFDDINCIYYIIMFKDCTVNCMFHCNYSFISKGDHILHSFGDHIVTKSGFDEGSHKNSKNTLR